MNTTQKKNDFRSAFENAADRVKKEVIELVGEVEHALEDVGQRLCSSASSRSAEREQRLARLGERFLAMHEAGRCAAAATDPDVLRMVAELQSSTAEAESKDS